MALSLSLVRVHTFKQAMQLRDLRNECREFMTGDQSYITRWRQAKFWLKYLRFCSAPVQGYLLYDHKKPIAFGILSLKDNAAIWPTYGVTKSYRGRGLGRLIAEQMLSLAQLEASDLLPVMGELLIDNQAVLSLDLKIGWQIIRKEKKNGRAIYIVKHVKDRYAPPIPPDRRAKG